MKLSDPKLFATGLLPTKIMLPIDTPQPKGVGILGSGDIP